MIELTYRVERGQLKLYRATGIDDDVDKSDTVEIELKINGRRIHRAVKLTPGDWDALKKEMGKETMMRVEKPL